MITYLYFIKVIICSSILLGYYFLVLRNNVYHQYNRFYLLLAVALSWCIPALPFSFVIEEERVIAPIYQAVKYISTQNYNTEAGIQNVPVAAGSFFKVDIIVLVIYLIVSLSMLVMFVKVMLYIYKLSKKYPARQYHSYKLFNTKEENAPFSFLKLIFWKNEIDIQTPVGRQILQHELTHVKEKHSLDKLYMQLNLIIGWFNPAFWIIKKELEMIHEFIADKKSVPNANTEAFAQMLLNTAFSGQSITVANSFFYSPVKRRLEVLTQKEASRFSYIQRIVALPLIAILVLFLSLKTKQVLAESNFSNAGFNQSSIQTDIENQYASATPLKLQFKLVIDAAHGGRDDGGNGNGGDIEKDFTLALSKKLAALAREYNIEVVTTRNEDISTSLQSRIAICNNIEKAVFLSVHINQSSAVRDNTYQFGINPTSANYKNSLILASSIANRLKTQHLPVEIVDKSMATVLQEIWHPALILECGNLDDPKNVIFLKNEKNAERLCRNILSGIVDYNNRAKAQ